MDVPNDELRTHPDQLTGAEIHPKNRINPVGAPVHASELPPPTDPWWTRQLDELVTFAGELSRLLEATPPAPSHGAQPDAERHAALFAAFVDALGPERKYSAVEPAGVASVRGPDGQLHELRRDTLRAMRAERDQLAERLGDSQAECGALQGEIIKALGAHDAMTRRLSRAEARAATVMDALERLVARIHRDFNLRQQPRAEP